MIGREPTTSLTPLHEGARARIAPPVRIDGAVATFTDELGGAVVLGRIGPFFLCRGSVAPRGPLAPGPCVLHRLGLDDTAARAIDHVLTWYGVPFDSVNARLREDQPLSWGVWHFAGDRFAEALATFFADAPAAAAARLGAFGIGVDRGAVTMARTRGQPLRGETAEDAIASSAIACAALARAGRDPEAMRAQLKTLADMVLRPALALPGGGRSTVGDTLRSSRALALILYCDLACGPSGPLRLAEAVEAGGTETDVIDAFVAGLERTRARELSSVIRILTSPEWDALDRDAPRRNA
jgi:hypothetical protein